MSPAHLHLAIVHVPVVLCPLATVLLIVAMVRGKAGDPHAQLGWVLLIVAAIASLVAYYSGPPAFEQLQGSRTNIQDLVEDHAVLGRAAFVGMVLLGVLAIQGLLRFAQDESPARWLRTTILILAMALCYLLAWSAHLGGQISHPEIRGSSFLFPRLE
ncbi:MAG: hypothetical protein MPN21_13705 [Thermoanaerobaculia bacterium]|nr:hypothetical protein [Thermoanaerobaculia bacterium]